MKRAKLIVFLLLVTVLFSNNIAVYAKSISGEALIKMKRNGNTKKEVKEQEYLVKSRNRNIMRDLKKNYKGKISVNHKLSDEKYLNNENIATLKLTDKEINSLKSSSDYTVEKNYTIEGLSSDSSSVLEDVPCTLEQFQNENDYEYFDNPAEFVPYEPGQDNSINNEVVPWNIEIVAGDPKTNEYRGSGIKVAVIDSGIDVHNDLNTNGWIDFSDTVKGYKPVDNSGHGTEVAGIIAARNNGIGTIGIAYDAEIYSVKILDSSNRSKVSSVIKAIEWCINNDIDVINMSFGLNEDSGILHEYIKKAADNDITIVAAAGNNNQVQYPAKYDEVISVGGIDKDLNIASYSPNGNCVDVFAPSEMAQTTGYVGTYAISNGTSIAAAHVTGIVASLKSKNSSLTCNHIKKILSESAVCINKDNDIYGLVNYQNAINLCDDFNIDTANCEENNFDVDFNSIKQYADNDNYVEGSWLKDAWENETRSDGTGHYSMINGLDTGYFARGAADYTGMVHNRWIVADTAYKVDDLDDFKNKTWTDENSDKNDKYPPYHANTHYTTGELCAPINFLYELSRRRLVLGEQLSMDSSAYNNKNEYKGVYIPVTMKKKMVDNMLAMYNFLKNYYGSSINMDSPYSRGYMVLGVLMHTLEDFYCHRAKVTWEMISASNDGSVGWYDVFGATCNDSHINCNNFSGNNWANYWKCIRYIKTYGGMPINNLKPKMNSVITIICNNQSKTFYNKANMVYEDNPFFYSNRYAASLYVTKATLQDMKDGKNTTVLYGFDSWGVPLFEAAFDYNFEGERWRY